MSDWINVTEAVRLIIERQDVPINRAGQILLRTCTSGDVRTRHDDGGIYGQKDVPTRYTSRTPQWWRGVEIDAEKGIVIRPPERSRQMEISRTDLIRWLNAKGGDSIIGSATANGSRRRPGPTPGAVGRYRAKDRELFPELTQLLESGMSITGAARKLAQEGRIKGGGTPDSKARRLAKLFNRSSR